MINSTYNRSVYVNCMCVRACVRSCACAFVCAPAFNSRFSHVSYLPSIIGLTSAHI